MLAKLTAGALYFTGQLNERFQAKSDAQSDHILATANQSNDINAQEYDGWVQLTPVQDEPFQVSVYGRNSQILTGCSTTPAALW